MRILLVRHGETEWNVANRIQGRKDSPLTKKGRRQILRVANKLLKYNIDVIYTSSLGRTAESAYGIARKIKCPLQADKRLLQKKWGVIEGMSKMEVFRRFPESGYSSDGELTNLDKRYNFVPAGGESWPEFQKRLKSFIDYLKEEHSTETVLIIVHRTVASLILGMLLGLDNRQMTTILIKSGEINCIDIQDGKTKLVLLEGKRFFKKIRYKKIKK